MKLRRSDAALIQPYAGLPAATAIDVTIAAEPQNAGKSLAGCETEARLMLYRLGALKISCLGSSGRCSDRAQMYGWCVEWHHVDLPRFLGCALHAAIAPVLVSTTRCRCLSVTNKPAYEML